MPVSEFVLLDDSRAQSGPASSRYYYGKAEHLCCYTLDEVDTTLRAVEQAQAQGQHAVGWVAYEAMLAWYPELARTAPTLRFEFPLVHFAVFEHLAIVTSTQVEALLPSLVTAGGEDAIIYNTRLNLSKAQYRHQFNQVQGHIQQGNSYQVNLTGRLKCDYQGDVVALYQRIREQQRVPYSALMHFKEYDLLSFSPELFFKKQGALLNTAPMKGTMPRCDDPDQDSKNRLFLQHDEKSLAENLMIVDLLRNDFNRVAQPGSVVVPQLFEVESYKTVHQMVSRVQGRVDEKLGLQAILKALFPCGSITGAPKIQTMKIIQALESCPRHVYTGAIGYVTPNNNMQFNVAIRTLLLKNNKAEMGIGGGIVADSDCNSEFQEMRLKARFVESVSHPFELIECFLYQHNSGYRDLQLHLQRLQGSARVFSFAFDAEQIHVKLMALKQKLNDNAPYKIRLSLNQQGQVTLHATKRYCQHNVSVGKVALYQEDLINSNNVLFQHKTTATSVRAFYDKVHARYAEDGFDEVIVMNRLHQITEGTRSNVFIVKDGRWYTPPVQCGLLPGIARAQVIEQYSVEESVLVVADVLAADEVWLSNSVWGLRKMKVQCHEPCPHH